jgi:hypothetical protein
MPSPLYKISSKSTNRFKSCAHLRSLNVRYFEMVEFIWFNSMESRSSSMSSPPYKTSSKSTKFIYTHLRRLNVRHFEMAETTRLKMWNRGHLNGSTCLPNFTKIHRSFQKLLVGDIQTDRHTHTHTHTQARDLISPHSFFESKLKMSKRKDMSGGRRKLLTRSVIICTLHQVWFGWSNQKEWDGHSM